MANETRTSTLRNSKNQTLIVAAIVLVLISAFIVVTSYDGDSDIVDDGKTTGGVTWTWDSSTKTLSFQKTSDGDGVIEPFGYEKTFFSQPYTYIAPWAKYVSDCKNLVIGEGVTKIDRAFFSSMGKWPELDSLTINTHLEISKYSFSPMVAIHSLKIIGQGPMKSVDYTMEPWNYCRQGVKEIVIGNGITEIPNDMFSGYARLKCVELPLTLKSIGDRAFYDNLGTTDVSMPPKLERIGAEAFYNCRLGSLNIPDTVTYIGEAAFKDNAAMTNVKLSKSMDYIPAEMFRNCNNLSVVVKPEIKTIGAGAFRGCSSLTSFDLEGVTELGKSAFSSSGLKSIVIPSSLKVLSNSVFSSLEVEHIYVPSTVEKIEEGAFGLTKTKCLEIADGVTLAKNAIFLTFMEQIKLGQVIVEDGAFSYSKFYDDKGSEMGLDQIAGHTFELKDNGLKLVMIA